MFTATTSPNQKLFSLAVVRGDLTPAPRGAATLVAFGLKGPYPKGCKHPSKEVILLSLRSHVKLVVHFGTQFYFSSAYFVNIKEL